MKKILLIFIAFIFFISNVHAENITKYSQSAVLMEKSTGKILYELDSTKENPPASMTKIMSMILIMDQIKMGKLAFNDKVVISENASSMGGSQVYLNTNETYKVEELLKSVAIASANAAVVALDEKTYGSVEKFVEKMNLKCKEIGCKNTNFVNPHGLDAEGHYSSSYDMALMARYLITNHEDILKFTSIYEDYLQSLIYYVVQEFYQRLKNDLFHLNQISIFYLQLFFQNKNLNLEDDKYVEGKYNLCFWRLIL